MRILVLAPHPFYQERGTPIAVDLVIRALSERGDEVDVLTYHEGRDRVYDQVRIHRIKPALAIGEVRPGFSWKKVVCDAYMFPIFISLVWRNRYDVVHAVEESALMATLVCPLWHIPFVFDMDSSMTTQLVNKHRFLRPISPVFRLIESLPMRFAEAVVPVCDALAAEVRKYRIDNIFVLKDVSLLEEQVSGAVTPGLKDELGLSGAILMYIGNLEPYQGIDLLLESFAIVSETDRTSALLIIGGAEKDIHKYRRLAQSLHIAQRTHFLGKRPLAHLGAYLRQADILVSPRRQGVNTPMKVYSYLHSGVPVLATRLPTHTQVMTNDIAVLADPNPASFAAAMKAMLHDETLRRRLGESARQHIEREHSYTTFREKLHRLYAGLEQRKQHRSMRASR